MMEKFPIIIMGTEFHEDLVNYIEDMKTAGTISPHDSQLFLITNNIDEAVEHISKNCIVPFGLRPKTKSRLLGE